MRRSSRFWLWRLPAAVGVAASLLFATGFLLALRGSVGAPLGAPPPAPAAQPPAKASGERLVLVVGDSLSRGTGDESGRGYPPDLLDRLRRRGPARIVNLAVNGAESSDLRELLSRPNVLALAASADLVLVSIGGNDLSHAAPRGGEGPARAIEEVSRARLRFAENLRAILDSLRRANPAATIAILGLYDPFGDQSPRGRIGTSVIFGWNALLEETALAVPNARVVPTFDLFQERPDRLALDRFHPNRKGYRAIAERIAQILPEGFL